MLNESELMSEQKDTDTGTKDKDTDMSAFGNNIDMFMRSVNKNVTVYIGFRRLTGKLTKVDKRFLILYIKNDTGTHIIPLKRIGEAVLRE